MKTYSEKLKDPRWQKKRLEILNRDKFACRNCGDEVSTLYVHHISYHGDPWETPDNLLMTLCESCHKEEEKDIKEEAYSLINSLKLSGFSSLGMYALKRVFQVDRGWTYYEPAFDIIKMVIDDNELWDQVSDLYFERLEKIRNGKTGEE